MEPAVTHRLPIEDVYSDEMLRAIGLLFVTAASCENALGIQLARLTFHPQEMNPLSLTTFLGMEAKVKLEKICTAARFVLSKERTVQIDRLCDKIRDTFLRRNELAHYGNGIGSRVDIIELQTIKLKRDGQLERTKPITLKQIGEYTHLMHGRVLQLDRLFTDCGIVPIPKQFSLAHITRVH